MLTVIKSIEKHETNANNKLTSKINLFINNLHRFLIEI